MASVLNSLFGGGASSAGSNGNLFGLPAASGTYTKWYNIHERYSWRDFRAEGIVAALVVLLAIGHWVGANANRAKAKAFLRAHGPLLRAEFALLGFDFVSRKQQDQDEASVLGRALREKSLFEFSTYATGRQNVAFVDVNLRMKKRFNPAAHLLDSLANIFYDTHAYSQDYAETIVYPFDGNEAKAVPSLPGAAELRAHDAKSTYDNFVWAVVHKDHMQTLRDERFDVSLTATKDHPKLPKWATVMSESSEVTDLLLSKDLIEAIEQAGDLFQYLIVSDQRVEKPRTLAETEPKKRIFLMYTLPGDDDYAKLLPLFQLTLRLVDKLVAKAHFPAEALRKVTQTRHASAAALRKAAEQEKAEERAAEREREKKQKREDLLKSMDAKEQKKFLDRERDKEMKKGQKRATIRG